MTQKTESTKEQEVKLDENAQIAIRKEKLQHLRDNKLAFPNGFERNVVAKCLEAKYNKFSKEELEAIEEKPLYKIAGRMVLRRIMGDFF